MHFTFFAVELCGLMDGSCYFMGGLFSENFLRLHALTADEGGICDSAFSSAWACGLQDDS